MKIVEIQAGAAIVMQISMNGQTIELPTVSVTVQDGALVTEAIRINGKLLGLDNSAIHVNLMCIRENKAPIIFKNVKCTMITYNQKLHYKVTAFAEGFENNRREAFRLYVGCGGIAQLGLNKSAAKVLVKDVSETGFSFLSEKEIESILNMPVRLVFNDMEYNISLMGIIVRKVKIDEQKYLYGCRLSVTNNQLSRYINDKQRQNMANGRQGISDKEKGKIVAALSQEEDAPAGNARRSNNTLLLKGEKKHRVTHFSGKREIDNVDRDERRKVFKNMYSGKRV